MTAALQDLAVVEVGRDVAAPFCARLLADLGADVTKVELPGGDPTRAWGPFPADAPHPERSGAFHALNAGKRGIVLDLDDPVGRERLDELLAGADLLVENLEAGERERFGLGFDAVLARHPHLVAVSLSPYGRSGPWADRPGTDLTASALASLPLGLGEPDREPLRLPFDQADHQAGLHAAAAALVALRERRRSGRGQAVDVATAQVMAYCVGGMWLVGAKLGALWRRRGRLQRGTIYPTGFFECADGFVCIASQTPKQWKVFLRLMDDPEWAREEHAADAVYLGGVDASPADEHFRRWLCRHTRRELVELAMAEGIVLGEVHTVDEVLESDQLAHRGTWAQLALDGVTVRVPKPGYRLGVTPTAIRGAGPALGALTEPLDRTGSAPMVASVTPEDPSGALEGVRVLDFGWNWAGPMASQLLADLGAEVIRVETRKRQDLMRFLDYTSYFFCHNNRSKKSITVDVTKPEGARVVRDLCRHVDVVMDNFSAGVMARNGLGYDDLRAVRPDIVCVSMSMAGQTGPLRGMRGFASIATGYAGLERMVGYLDGTAEGLMSFGLGDTTLAVQGALGALAALHHRDRTGEGQLVDVSQVDSAVATLAEPILDWQLNGRLPEPLGNTHTAHSPHGIYRTAGEDRWLAVAVRGPDDWRALAGVLGRGDWASDPELETAAGRRSRAAEVEAALVGWCAARERDDAVEALVAVGVPAAPVLELPERDGHPQFVARDLVVEHRGGGFDECRVYATPWLLSATPARVHRPAPALGAHNDEVFRGLMGLSDDEIAALTEAEVLV
ncbi:MAG: CoA transferase [Acidimicrobiia bacterium]|nr:CoA transferase [Acidimicrobiia bacterium]